MPRGRVSDPVWVRCHGRFWRLRDVPASTWIQAAVSPDMSGVWPGLVRGADAEQIYELWRSEPDMQARSILVAHAALGRASNREWHWALNMIKEIESSWTHVNGILVREGVHADRIGLASYLDAAYTLFERLLKPDDFKAFETRLRKLSAGVTVKPRMSSRDDLLKFAKD